MTNIITACFGGTRYANTRPAWLIDHGMVLKIEGVELPETYFVDFANSKAEQATRVLGNAEGVVIPDQYFLSNAPQIFAWVYLTTGSSGFTTLQVTIPLSQRPDVSTEPPTPQETDLIEQAIAALNDGVERAETAAEGAEQSAEEAKAAAENIQQTVEDALQEAKDSGEFDGKNGATFIPDVDADGNISWTNDGDLPNPQTRNIKGPKGDKLKYADLTAADKEDLIQGPIADAQTAAVNAVNSAGTTQVSNVNQAGETQTAAVQKKGAEVIASIPSDYTDLTEDVDDLKRANQDIGSYIWGMIRTYPNRDLTIANRTFSVEGKKVSSVGTSGTSGGTFHSINLTGNTLRARSGSISSFATYDDDFVDCSLLSPNANTVSLYMKLLFLKRPTVAFTSNIGFVELFRKDGEGNINREIGINLGNKQNTILNLTTALAGYDKFALYYMRCYTQPERDTSIVLDFDLEHNYESLVQ